MAKVQINRISKQSSACLTEHSLLSAETANFLYMPIGLVTQKNFIPYTFITFLADDNKLRIYACGKW